MTRQLILARRLVDGNGAAIDGGAVLITDGLVQAVGPAAEVGRPDGVDILDLGDSTLLPGLIDVHNHVTFSGDMRVTQQVIAHDTDAMLAQGRVNAANLLAAGVTTVRDLGALGDTAFRLTREIADGQSAGPEILPSTAQLTTPGGPNAALGGGCADLAAAREPDRCRCRAGRPCRQDHRHRVGHRHRIRSHRRGLRRRHRGRHRRARPLTGAAGGGARPRNGRNGAGGAVRGGHPGTRELPVPRHHRRFRVSRYRHCGTRADDLARRGTPGSTRRAPAMDRPHPGHRMGTHPGRPGHPAVPAGSGAPAGRRPNAGRTGPSPGHRHRRRRTRLPEHEPDRRDRAVPSARPVDHAGAGRGNRASGRLPRPDRPRSAESRTTGRPDRRARESAGTP